MAHPPAVLISAFATLNRFRSKSAVQALLRCQIYHRHGFLCEERVGTAPRPGGTMTMLGSWRTWQTTRSFIRVRYIHVCHAFEWSYTHL